MGLTCRAGTVMISGEVDVSPQSRPACLGVPEPFRVILDPPEHVKEAPSTLVIALSNRLIAQVPDLVQIRCLHIVLGVSSNHRCLDSLLSVLLGKMQSCLVEEEATAYLDLFIFSQLHLV